MNDLLVGCSAFGILHTDKDPPLSLEEQFRMAAESEIFDYVEKNTTNRRNRGIQKM